MRALDLWRKAGDVRGAADESHDIGLVFKARDASEQPSMRYRTRSRVIARWEIAARIWQRFSMILLTLSRNPGADSESAPLLKEAESLTGD